MGTGEDDLHALETASELTELGNRLGEFNLFKVLGFEHGEIRHSRVLAWLLDPRGSHGLEELFLRRWLDQVFATTGTAGTPTREEAAGASFRSVQVLREWGHIDVLARLHLTSGEEWVIAIENKVWAKQGYQQLERYRQRLAASFPKARRVLVFLTVRDEAPADGAWLVMRHAQVAAVLESCLVDRRSHLAEGPRVLLENYLTTIRRMTMPDQKLIRMAREIYEKHRRAIDFIVEQREDWLTRLTQAVEKQMRQAAASGAPIEPMSCGNGYVRFLPREWSTEKNRQGMAWGKRGSAFVLLEIVLRVETPVFKIVAGKAPPAWNKELFSLARKESLNLGASSAPTQWMTVHGARLTRPDDDSDLDVAAAALWRECEVEQESESFQKAMGLVREHLDRLP